MDNNKLKQFDMPGWLLKGENYSPQKDKDTFINKSILSVLSILSRIRAQGSSKSAKYSVNATVKVAFTFMLILLISFSRNFTFVIIINVYLISTLCLMDADVIVKILKISLVTTFFTFIVLLPSAIWGNSFNTVMITTKEFATITAVSILSHSTRWNSITSALKDFFVPNIFIAVLDITIKYIVMLGDFALNMLYALKLRSVGKNKTKNTSISGIAGTIFIKSKEMADDMYAAMECRGFTGEYYVYSNSKINIADYIYIVMNIGIVFIFMYFERI